MYVQESSAERRKGGREEERGREGDRGKHVIITVKWTCTHFIGKSRHAELVLRLRSLQCVHSTHSVFLLPSTL